MDIREKGEVTIDDVSIVREYLNMFPNDLSGVPLERQVEF